MKYAMPLLLLITLCLSACGPKETPGPDKYYHPGIPSTINVTNTGSTHVAINIDPGRKPTDSLRISVSGWPANVSGVLSAPAGIPPFVSLLSVSAQFAQPGTYELTMKIESMASGVYNYPIQLVVAPTTDCPQVFTGAFTHSSVSNDSGIINSSFMEMVTTSGSGIKIANVGGGTHGYQLAAYASVDCITGTFTVAPQAPETASGFPADVDSIQGIGGQANGTFYLKYSVHPIGGTAWKNYTDSLKW